MKRKVYVSEDLLSVWDFDITFNEVHDLFEFEEGTLPLTEYGIFRDDVTGDYYILKDGMSQYYICVCEER